MIDWRRKFLIWLGRSQWFFQPMTRSCCSMCCVEVRKRLSRREILWKNPLFNSDAIRLSLLETKKVKLKFRLCFSMHFAWPSTRQKGWSLMMSSSSTSFRKVHVLKNGVFWNVSTWLLWKCPRKITRKIYQDINRWINSKNNKTNRNKPTNNKMNTNKSKSKIYSTNKRMSTK